MFNTIINYPPFTNSVTSNFFVGTLTIDTAGEQFFAYGLLVSESWTAGSKDIVGVRLSYNSVTTNPASVWNISLQEVSGSNPKRPSGIPLAQWSGSVTSSIFAASTVVTHSFTSSYSVTPETQLGILFKYDTFTAPTSLNVRGFSDRGEFTTLYGAVTTANSGSTWTVGTNIVSLQFVCSDGSALFFKGVPNSISQTNTTSNDYTSTTTGTGIDSGDERGMLWIPKKTYDITKFELMGRLTQATSVVEFKMYRDTTLLASSSVTPLTNRAITDFSSFPVNIYPPIRVYPGDNIRFTTAPVSGNTRHLRFSFDTEESMKNYLGGDNDETNLSFTNRVDGGAWNTPPSAAYSIIPLQIYGMEVTGSELITGSQKISGSVSLNNSSVGGARVFALRQSDGVVASTTSSVDGTYQFNVTSSVYHVFTEYESGGQKYNALSYSNIQPV